VNLATQDEQSMRIPVQQLCWTLLGIYYNLSDKIPFRRPILNFVLPSSRTTAQDLLGPFVLAKLTLRSLLDSVGWLSRFVGPLGKPVPQN